MLELQDLSVSFSRDICILDKLNLRIPTGKTTMVIGESGSGKSVMLSAILGILPPRTQISGNIFLDGVNLTRLSKSEMTRLYGRVISYIPQGSGNSLNPLLTVGYQIAEPIMAFHGIKKTPAFSEAISWMRQLGIGMEEQVACSFPHTLSGGMKQRVLIAMGAAGGAETLLADEPTKGLDDERTARVIELFHTLKNKTILCVSHDMAFARALGNNISVIYAAQQVEYADKQSFFAEPLHPYSQMLLDAMPENGLHISTGFAPSRNHYTQLGCRFYSRCPCVVELCEQPPPMVKIGERKVRCWHYVN